MRVRVRLAAHTPPRRCSSPVRAGPVPPPQSSACAAHAAARSDPSSASPPSPPPPPSPPSPPPSPSPSPLPSPSPSSFGSGTSRSNIWAASDQFEPRGGGSIAGSLIDCRADLTCASLGGPCLCRKTARCGRPGAAQADTSSRLAGARGAAWVVFWHGKSSLRSARVKGGGKRPDPAFSRRKGRAEAP